MLTDGQGNVKKWGAVQYGVTTWQDPSTWITYNNRRYTVNNFKLFNQSCPRCTEYINVGARYPWATIKQIDKVSSFTKCKDLCTRHVECKVWVFDRSDKECKLKSEEGQMKPDKSEKVSGTRACFDYNSDNNNDSGTDNGDGGDTGGDNGGGNGSDSYTGGGSGSGGDTGGGSGSGSDTGGDNGSGSDY